MSGISFTIGIDPLASSTSKLGAKFGSLTRFCADAIGLALQQPGPLLEFFAFFGYFEIISGLTINAAKTIFVLTSGTPEQLLSWLLECLPAWADIKIGTHGKHLGVWMGLTDGSV